MAHLDDLGVRTAAVSRGGVHPSAFCRNAFLPEGALFLLHTPAALKSGVGLQTHATAVSQCVALIQVSCWRQEEYFMAGKDGLNNPEGFHRLKIKKIFSDYLFVSISKTGSMSPSKSNISPKCPRNCTAESFLLSAIPSPNPIGHGAALKQPRTNYCLLNGSVLITLTYQNFRKFLMRHKMIIVIEK